MSAGCVDATTVASAVSAQIPQIRERVDFYITVNSPFANAIGGETFGSNQGDSILSAVANRVAPGHSLTRPVFTKRGNACGLQPQTDETGQTVYSTDIGVLRGKSLPICVNQAVGAVKTSFEAADRSLNENLKNLHSADIRSQLETLSGAKFVAASGYSVEDLITGGINDISADYKGILPTHPMTFRALEVITDYMNDVLKLSKYGSGADAHYRVITGTSQNRYFRNEAGVKEVQLARIQGSYGEGEKTMTGYAWQDLTYRGIALGLDEEPLRFNCLDADGNPEFIEPVIGADADAGKTGIPNPEWLQAKHEVGFIMAPNSFVRVTPDTYSGEGLAKFAPQMAAGKLEWFYSRDCNNSFGDVGWLQYEMQRAYRALQPYGVIPFLYKRCIDQLGFDETCTEYSNSVECSEL